MERLDREAQSAWRIALKILYMTDINLAQVVIPGLTKPAPYLIRGNPVFFWIPAGVYPGQIGRE
jgi:hypothetical protein